MDERFESGRVIWGVNAKDDLLAIMGCYFTSGLVKGRCFNYEASLCEYYRAFRLILSIWPKKPTDPMCMFRFRRINILRTYHHGFSMVIGATHTPSSRLYAPPNFISILPQRPSSRWTTASHSKPELSLFPHSKILENKAKALKIVHQVERIDSKTPTGYRSVTKMPSGGHYPGAPALL